MLLSLAALGLAFASPSPSAAATIGAYLEETSQLESGHGYGTATALLDGKVLVAGGQRTLSYFQREDNKKAEIFDPTTGKFTPVLGEMTEGRYMAAASLLGDGTVLIAGGRLGPTFFDASDTAEIYDPSSGEFSATSALGVPRTGAFAAPLPDGTALVGGGACANCIEKGAEAAHIWATTEIYDPSTGEFTPGPPMLSPRRGAVAAPLPDGRVIVVGGINGNGEVPTTEIYDPSTGTFEPGPPFPGHAGYVSSAAVLTNGRVAVFANVTWEYDATRETFIYVGLWGEPYEHAAAPLPEGRVLLTGISAPIPDEREKKAWIFVGEPFPTGQGIDFGSVPVGDTSGPQTLTITDRREGFLEIEAAALTGPDAEAFEIIADECSGEALVQGDSCALELTATPTTAGPLSAALQIDDDYSAVTGPHLFALTVDGTVLAPKEPVRGESPSSFESGTSSPPAADPPPAGAAPGVTPSGGSRKPNRVCRRHWKRRHATVRAARVRCVPKATRQDKPAS